MNRIRKMNFIDRELRVANITEEGRYGGPRARIALIAERLNVYGVKTTVVCPEQSSKPFRAKLKGLGVPIKCMRLTFLNREISQMIRYGAFFFSEIFGLLTYLRRGRFDVVHCNGAYQIKGVIAGKLAGARVLWHLNDTRKHPIILLGFKLLAKGFCDGLIFGGNRVMAHYMSGSSLPKKPYNVIQAPVDAAQFSSHSTSIEPALKAEDGLNIVTVANINPAKGLEYFIEMVKWLNEAHENLRFIIVGNLFESQTKYYEKLRVLETSFGIHNLVFKHGVADVRPFLKMADIFVCSSAHEAGPMSVWEAMAMEKAIVSTDVGDVARYIRNGENGFIVPPRDARALAEKVGILIENEALRKQFASRVRKIAVENFDVDICAKKHVLAYEMVLGLRESQS